MGKVNTFKIYIEEKCYKKIENALSIFVSCHKSFIQNKARDGERVTNSELNDFSVEAVYIDDKGNNKIEFDVVCKCIVEYSFLKYQGRHSDPDGDYISDVWLVVHASTFINDLKNIKIFSVEPYEKEKKNKPLNGDMVPIISAKEYEYYAKEIIRRYYGTNYDFSKPIKAEELAKRMGLTIHKLHNGFCFEKDKAIFAQIYFEDCETSFYDKNKGIVVKKKIEANTILIDEYCQSMYSYGSIDVTIAHECVHFYLHKKAYQFSKFINENDVSCISCFYDGRVIGVSEDNKNESYMEAQANGIAPYLVMPTIALKNEAEMLFNEYNRDSSPIDFMDRLIRDLRDEFGVTISLVKKRLKDLGYLQNIGTLEWDKSQQRYIDSYQYKKGSLASDETYSITFEDYSKMVSDTRDTLFRKCFSEDYIFVQNHVVLDDKKYVIRDDDGECNLTEYAKHHIDECALKFKVKAKVKYFSKGNIGTFCYLCKGIADDMEFDLKLADSSFISNEENMSELFARHQNAQKTIIRIIEDAPTLGACLQEITKLYDVVPKELSSYGINHVTFSRYINDKVEKIDIRKAICICKAFKFTPKVSDKFINKFSTKGIMDDKEGNAFYCILNSMRGSSMKSINEFLTKQELDPLF